MNKEELLNRVIDSPLTLSEKDIAEATANTELRELYACATMLRRSGVEMPQFDTEAELEQLHKLMEKAADAEKHTAKHSRSFSRAAAVILIAISISAVAAVAVLLIDYTNFSLQSSNALIESEVEAFAAPDAFIFDNVEMQDIAATLGRYYKVEPVFESDDAKHVRLYLQIEKDKSIEEVAELLNHFKKVNITVSDGKLIIK